MSKWMWLMGAAGLGTIALAATGSGSAAQSGGSSSGGGSSGGQAPRCARVKGFSVHADVSVPAFDRKRLERLIRYVARPPVATERLHRRPDGKLYYQFRKPWRDGTRGVVFTPTELIEKLVAPVPPKGSFVQGSW